jgi:pSer/pThr/pTyr-binding forkhead associated (FHA) protein
MNATLDAERAAALERAQAQEARLAALQVELDSVRTRLQELPAAGLAEPRAVQPRSISTVLRVLVRLEGGTEVVYPLGRHTTVGRTPDNDIQVNTTFVSRHHAVLLAGTDHCIVEDLNSTNGLQVNGQRVSRRVLYDGDTVTIGKTHFRYQQRS